MILCCLKISLKINSLALKKHYPFYLRWMSLFLTRCSCHGAKPDDEDQLEPFLNQLAKSKEEWQVKQARDALLLSLFTLAQATAKLGVKGPLDK